MSGGDINVAKCLAYLDSVGIIVAPVMAEVWLATEKATRERRRAHNRELRRSCGHFQTYHCQITSDEGSFDTLVCSLCGRQVWQRKLSPPHPPGGREPMPAERIA